MTAGTMTTGTTAGTTETTTEGTTATTTEPSGGFVVPVRVRLTAVVALLVTAALAGAGLIVYFVEIGRIDASVAREVEQELNEFALLRDEGKDPETGQPFTPWSLLYTFLSRNVPDDDEMLVGWLNGEPEIYYPKDPLLDDSAFLEVAARVAEQGGTEWLDTEWGEVRVTGQPLAESGDVVGALLVVAFLDEDRAELLDTMRTYTIVALLSLFVVTAVAGWQSDRLLRPLRVLRDTAEGIGTSADLSRRIPVRGNDDITALTRTFNGMIDQLEAAFAGQRQFLDDAGHELKTPLTVLRGHLELLETGSPEEIAETRDLLLDEVDRMSRLVGDLILLAKSNRPDFVALSPAEVGPLTSGVLAKARALGDRRWMLDEAADVVAHIDEQRITQAVLQLCDNAVKHTVPSDEIAIGSADDGDRLRLWVRDTGPGVPPEHREHIFERFGRARHSSGDEGFGLGLSIVRAIATAHGGTVHVEEAAPRGACFVLTLPRTRPTEEDAWPGS